MWHRISCFAVLLASLLVASRAGRSKRKSGYSSTIQLVPDDPPLYRACEKGNLRMAKIAVEEHGDDVNLADNHGRTGLHWACTNNHEHMVEWLLTLPNINVNAVDKDLLTPIHIASHGGYYRIVRRLLEAGADQHMQTHHFHIDSHAHHFASRHAHRSKHHAHTVKTLVGHAFGVLHLVPHHHEDEL